MPRRRAAARPLNAVEIDGRTWLRVVTDTGDKVHLVAPFEGKAVPASWVHQAFPALGAAYTLFTEIEEKPGRAPATVPQELVELREHFKHYDASELVKARWRHETRCNRRWRHMATAEDEAELRPGPLGQWGLRDGDRACSKCGTPEYGDVPRLRWPG